MARKLKITVDKNLCVSNATCIAFAPNTFELDANGQSEPVNPEAPPLCVAVKVTPVKLAGKLSLTTAPVTLLGPKLVTIIV